MQQHVGERSISCPASSMRSAVHPSHNLCDISPLEMDNLLVVAFQRRFKLCDILK
jgi:hypothetical protein